ncbi:hypothetical protein FRB90_002786 [Tulasnella sp. 427]|nr:hypothetical protein FRB90_002786 [Tulasnella sp. 427]
MDDLLPPFPALLYALERAHWLQIAPPSSLEVPNTPLAACTTPATTQSNCFNRNPTPIATPHSTPLVTYASLPSTPRSSPSVAASSLISTPCLSPLLAFLTPATTPRSITASLPSPTLPPHDVFSPVVSTQSTTSERHEKRHKTSSTGSSQASHSLNLRSTVTTSPSPSELELENAILRQMLVEVQDKSAMLETEFRKLLVAAQSTLLFKFASEDLQSVQDHGRCCKNLDWCLHRAFRIAIGSGRNYMAELMDEVFDQEEIAGVSATRCEVAGQSNMAPHHLP